MKRHNGRVKRSKEYMNEQPNEFVISAILANQILQYLITKPFVEVHQLVIGLQQLKPIETGIDLSKVETIDDIPPITKTK